MANDDWVEDVRRWYFGGNAPASVIAAEAEVAASSPDLGYEAANPPLQARHWPDAPTGADA